MDLRYFAGYDYVAVWAEDLDYIVHGFDDAVWSFVEDLRARGSLD